MAVRLGGMGRTLAPQPHPPNGEAVPLSALVYRPKASLLHIVQVTDDTKSLAHRPLPYGSPLPDTADAHLSELGFRRVSKWHDATPVGWWCTVRPLA